MIGRDCLVEDKKLLVDLVASTSSLGENKFVSLECMLTWVGEDKNSSAALVLVAWTANNGWRLREHKILPELEYIGFDIQPEIVRERNALLHWLADKSCLVANIVPQACVKSIARYKILPQKLTMNPSKLKP